MIYKVCLYFHLSIPPRPFPSLRASSRHFEPPVISSVREKSPRRTRGLRLGDFSLLAGSAFEMTRAGRRHPHGVCNRTKKNEAAIKITTSQNTLLISAGVHDNVLRFLAANGAFLRALPFRVHARGRARFFLNFILARATAAPTRFHELTALYAR